MAAELRVDVNSMPRIVFTGDSQTVGCVGAMDYAQMIAREVPLRVFNRSVGGSNTTHLLAEFGGGTVSVRAGDRVVDGDGVGWHAGPYIGQVVRIAGQEYTVDAIEPVDYANRICRLHLTEPAREDYSGTDYEFEPGWRVRVAEVKPRYACFMFTVNDASRTPEEFKERLADIVGRCREAGISPLFLSGVPFMDAESGGSHPGAVSRTMQRAQDLLEFCTERNLPYADVFRTLERLDQQRTSVWADTIHPTDDGSLLVVHALRFLLGEMGALGNPYSVHGYRAPGMTLPEPYSSDLAPISTAQPRRDSANRLNQAGHTLQAQRIRDEYGLIAEHDGLALTSDTPLLFRVGVGTAERLEAFELDVKLGAPGELHLYNWANRAWTSTSTAARIEPDGYVHADAIWVAVTGDTPTVDYLGVLLSGEVEPWQAPSPDRAVRWPTPGQFDWTQDGNAFPNGSLSNAANGSPAGWAGDGAGAVFLPAGVVAEGVGEFGGPRGDQFACPGALFTQTVRPLDMLVIEADIEAGGNFLVEKIIDDETLDLRRSPKTDAGAVRFSVQRRSGLGAVPGGCCLEVTEGSAWRMSVPLSGGRYRLGFFYRCFNPTRMSAGALASSTVSINLDGDLTGGARSIGAGLETSYVWLRGWEHIDMPEDGELRIKLGALGPEAVQYTGFSLEKRESR